MRPDFFCPAFIVSVRFISSLSELHTSWHGTGPRPKRWLLERLRVQNATKKNNEKHEVLTFLTMTAHLVRTLARRSSGTESRYELTRGSVHPRFPTWNMAAWPSQTESWHFNHHLNRILTFSCICSILSPGVAFLSDTLLFYLQSMLTFQCHSSVHECPRASHNISGCTRLSHSISECLRMFQNIQGCPCVSHNVLEWHKVTKCVLEYPGVCQNHVSIYPSIHPPIHLSVILPFIHQDHASQSIPLDSLSVHSSFHLSADVLLETEAVCPSTCPLLYLSIHPSNQLSIH